MRAKLFIHCGGRARTPLALVVLLLTTPAKAAPFCVSIQGLNDDCIYADGGECQARAIKLGGSCVANPAEIVNTAGPGRFCLVVGNQATQCIYTDRASCQADASKRNTACVQALNPPGNSALDPFALRRPY